MKQWKIALREIPKVLRERYGYKAHMRERPRGMARAEWIGVWMDQHGAKWPLKDHVAAGKLGLPRTNHLPKISPKVRYRVARRDQTAATAAAFLETFEWRQLRMRVLTTRGARCECCGASPADGVTVINVDHIKPRRDFPELALTESNLQVLCAVCNHGKGNWDRTDWRPEQSRAVSLPPDWHEPLWTKRPS